MFIEDYIRSSIDTKKKVLEDKTIIETISKAADAIVDSYKNGGKLISAGNGGSAGDAQHIAGELVLKFYIDRPGLAAISLSTDTSVLTAIGNDACFENVFARQIQANGNKGDIFLAISTSGNSVNIINALEEARKKGVVTIGLTGEKTCKMDDLCDFLIKVPSSDTPKIQESQMMIGHILCAIVEKKLFQE